MFKVLERYVRLEWLSLLKMPAIKSKIAITVGGGKLASDKEWQAYSGESLHILAKTAHSARDASTTNVAKIKEKVRKETHIRFFATAVYTQTSL